RGGVLPPDDEQVVAHSGQMVAEESGRIAETRRARRAIRYPENSHLLECYVSVMFFPPPFTLAASRLVTSFTFAGRFLSARGLELLIEVFRIQHSSLRGES